VSQPVLRIEGLVRHFDDVRAVDDVSFSADWGTVLGFIGPNGAGKTTTMRILATLETPQRGDAWVDGHSVVDAPEKVRHVTGFMPDYAGMYGNTTVFEYLDFFARSYGLRADARRRAVTNIVDFMAIGELVDRQVEKLSKGLRQRVALGRALIHDPQLLILDEPAANLDPRARIELRTLIRELAAGGKTVLLSSHILTELAEMCDTVAVIERGRILATGTVPEILAGLRPKRLLSVRLAGEARPLDRFLLEQPGIAGVTDVAGRTQFEFAGDETEQAALLARLVSAGFPVTEFTAHAAGLEDAFIEITGQGFRQ
jgi:ABC-2 type transport system ATP-binding protein